MVDTVKGCYTCRYLGLRSAVLAISGQGRRAARLWRLWVVHVERRHGVRPVSEERVEAAIRELERIGE